MNFVTTYDEILTKIDEIDPVSYHKTRNYIDGSVSYLSPYISRGVISTKLVLNKLLEKGFKRYEIEKFLQELGWRDYWQQVWVEKGDLINRDLKSVQANVNHTDIPVAICKGKTEIEIIDRSILELKEKGYMHNHMRMYVASIACNIAKSHWKSPAKWLYYHLLDGDWASNALSWQWVAGSNANKKYYANQDNINNFFYSNQRETFLDVTYEELFEMDCPERLGVTYSPSFETELPKCGPIHVTQQLPTLIYNYYNLDPLWRKEEDCNRILLLEPSVFSKYPVAQKCIDFMMELKNNIKGIQVYVGEFDQFVENYQLNNIIFKEHPLNSNYSGHQDERDWMFNVKGYYPSFFAFWKKCKKEIKQW